MATSIRSILLVATLLATAISAQAQVSSQFDFGGMQTAERTIDRTFPVDDAPFVFVSNRFGKVAVRTWDNPLVHVTVQITAGASDRDAAERVAQAIDTAFDLHDDAIDIETMFPADSEIDGAGYRIDYELRVPQLTSISVENVFGDIAVSGIGGGLSIDARFGNIDLENLAGPVRVRAHGEFDLNAVKLENGGYFLLRGTRASLRDTQGELHVSNYLGSVELRRVRSGDATIVSESGPIHFYLNESIATDIVARADFGSIVTDERVETIRWGESELADLRTDDAVCRVSLHATFADATIISDQVQTRLLPTPDEGHRIQEESTEVRDLRGGQVLRIDASVGDITIVGTQDDRVTVRARRSARVRDIDNARLAIEGLGLRYEDHVDALTISTAILEDMEALQCDEYSIDLVIECPENVAVSIAAERGDIRVESISGETDIQLGAGNLTASSLGGKTTLVNHRGDVTVSGLIGQASIMAERGVVRARECSDAIEIAYGEGRAIVDTPSGDVAVTGVAGDTRIIALEGIRGDIEVKIDEGSVSLATPDYADATFWLNTEDGEVRSAYPVTGSIEKGSYRFQGRLNEGTHRVLLETKRGNIRVD